MRVNPSDHQSEPADWPFLPRPLGLKIFAAGSNFGEPFLLDGHEMDDLQPNGRG